MIESIFMVCVAIWLIKIGRDIKKELSTPRTRSAQQRRRDLIIKIGRN